MCRPSNTVGPVFCTTASLHGTMSVIFLSGHLQLSVLVSVPLTQANVMHFKRKALTLRVGHILNSSIQILFNYWKIQHISHS